MHAYLPTKCMSTYLPTKCMHAYPGHVGVVRALLDAKATVDHQLPPAQIGCGWQLCEAPRTWQPPRMTGGPPPAVAQGPGASGQGPDGGGGDRELKSPGLGAALLAKLVEQEKDKEACLTFTVVELERLLVDWGQGPGAGGASADRFVAVERVGPDGTRTKVHFRPVSWPDAYAYAYVHPHAYVHAYAFAYPHAYAYACACGYACGYAGEPS